MTVTIKELMESRSANSTERGQIIGFRSFLIHGDATTPVNTGAQALAQLEAVDSSTIQNPPTDGAPYPEDPNLRAVTWRVDRHLDSDGNGAWLIIWTYTSPIGGGATADESIRISTQVEPFFDDVWITGASLPQMAADGTYNLSPTRVYLSGGQNVNNGNEPVSELIRRAVIEVTVIQRPPLFLRTWVFITGKRNENLVNFSGALFPTGMLLYDGPNIDQLDVEKFQVTHRFVADERNHLRQMAERDVDGQIKRDEEVATQEDWKASTVFWVQPFPETADFSRLRI